MFSFFVVIYSNTIKEAYLPCTENMMPLGRAYVCVSLSVSSLLKVSPVSEGRSQKSHPS